MNSRQPAQPMSGAPNRIQSGVQPGPAPIAMPSGAMPITATPQAMPPPQGMSVMPVPGPPVRQPPPAMAQQLARGLLNGRR